MTECPDVLMRDQLPEYVRGTLSAEEAARVDRHLEGCASCRQEVALLRWARAVAAQRTPVVDVASIVAKLPAPPSKVLVLRPPRRTMTVRGWQYAAAAVIVLAAGSLTMWRAAPIAEPLRVADSATVAVPATRVVDTPSAVVSPSDEREGISFGGGLSDLSVTDLQALLVQMDSVKTLPSRDPASMTPVIEVKEGGKSE